jgi:DNA-binding PadR family transcriptional regulator
MKLKRSEIEELLKKHMATSQDIEMSRERFLKLQKARNDLQAAVEKLQAVQAKGDFASLGYVDQLVLTAIHLLQGNGSNLQIVDKVNKILKNRTFDRGSVIVSLDNLERGGLISSQPAGTQKSSKRLVFEVTPKGEAMLREVRSAAKQLMEALDEKTFRKA